MAAVSDWQLGLAAATGLAALALGGWLQRRRSSDQKAAEYEISPENQPPSRVAQLEEEVAALKQQLQAAHAVQESLPTQREPSDSHASLEAELQDAKEEAELILLQLHQVQEELEHYFLLSQDQQQQLDQKDTLIAGLQQEAACQAEALTKAEAAYAERFSKVSDQEQRLRAIRLRLVDLIRSGSVAHSHRHSEVSRLLQRQQSALRRFQQLHQSASAVVPQSPPGAVNDELSFL